MDNDEEQYIENSVIISSEALIQPWVAVKKNLEYMLSSLKMKNSRSRASPGHEFNSDEERTPYLLSIPHGFQLIESIDHPSNNSYITSMLYMPGMRNQYATMDGNHVHLWTESKHTLKLPIKKPRNDEKASSVMAITQWEFAAKWRVIVIATSLLELKTLTSDFSLTSVKSSVKPVLNLNFIEDTNEIIVAGVGNIRIWKFIEHRSSYVLDAPRLCISDLNIDEWVTISVYVKSGQIYAAYDNNVNLYDYKSGERLDTMLQIHDGTITAMIFDESNQYLITGSRDGEIKVWNRKSLIFELTGHFKGITGLILNPFSISVSANSNISPLLLSSSLDGSVKQWSLDTGVCNYILETGAECLGIKWLKGENFVTNSKSRLYMWNLNHYYWTFSFIKAPIISMQRYRKGNSARILAVTQDYSIRLICPISGSILCLAFPPITNKSLKCVVYNPYAEEVIALMNEGSILVISTKTNPGTVVGEMRPETKEALCVIEGALIPNSELDQNFILFGGTEAGQIVLVDKAPGLRYSFVIQAHSASILDMKYSDHCSNLYSISNGMIIPLKLDNIIKIWKVQFNQRRMDLNDTFDLLMPLKSVTLISSFESSLNFLNNMAVDSRNNVVAVVSENSDVNMFSCTKEIRQIEKKTKDEPHQKLTSITCLEALKIFATSGTDRTVKIWDEKDNSLIREMNFGSPVYSVCFANERGDLLVGLVDQIAIIRLQDYLPDFILKRLLSLDDIIEYEKEVPASFDETVDFWYIYRQNISRKQTSAVVDVTDIRGQTVEENSKYVLYSDDGLNQRRFSISLDNLSIIDSASNGTISKKPFKPLSDSRHLKNLNHMQERNYRRPTENYSLLEPEPVMESFQAENLPSLDRPNFPQFKKKKYIGRESEDEFLNKMAQRRMSLLRFVKIMVPVIQVEETKPQKKAKTAGFKRQAAAALPNSVATSDLRHVEADKIFNLGQRRKSKSDPVQYANAKRKSSLAKIPEFLLDFQDASSELSDTKKQRKSKKGKAKKTSKSKKKSLKSNNKEKTIENGHDRDNEDNEDIDNEDIDNEDSTQTSEHDEPTIQEPEVSKIVMQYEAVKDGSPKQDNNTTMKKVCRKKKKKKHISATTSEVDEWPKETVLSFAEVDVSDPLNEDLVEDSSEQEDIILKEPIVEAVVEPKVNIQDKADIVRLFLSNQAADKIKVPEAVAEKPKTELSQSSQFKSAAYKKSAAFVLKKRESNPVQFQAFNSHVERKSKIEENSELTDFEQIKADAMKNQKKYILSQLTADQNDDGKSWDLFSRNRHNPNLGATFGTSWFAGIPDHLPATIENLISSITETMSTGDTWVKVEAIKALSGLYHTFREDISDPALTIFQPQVQLLANENAEVRLSVLNSVLSCGIINDEITAATIPLLADSNELVRKAAMIYLEGLGVSSKSELITKMEELNLITISEPAERYISILDKLYLETMSRTAKDGHKNLLDWVEKVPDFHNSNRPNSSRATLVFSEQDMEYQRSQIFVKNNAMIFPLPGPGSIKSTSSKISKLSRY